MDERDEPVLEVARAIRPFLPELVGPAEAREVDRHIAEILNGRPAVATAAELRPLLESRKATRDFMAEVLSDAPRFEPPRFQREALRDIGYEGLAGDPPPVHAGKFGCPRSDYVWYRPSVGSPIPACPTHGVVLVRLP